MNAASLFVSCLTAQKKKKFDRQTDKLKALKKYHVSYMAEDDPDNIVAMQDVTKVICMNAKCNQHLIEECACRCNSFEEVLDYMRSECEKFWGISHYLA